MFTHLTRIKKHGSPDISNEPFIPHFDIAVIGIGQAGCAALRQYRLVPHNSFYVNRLYFCEEPFVKTAGEIFRIIEEYPILFWFADLHDTNVQQTMHTFMVTHRQCHGENGLSVCVIYQNQESLVNAELAACMDNIVFVDNQLDSLSRVTVTLLDDLSESGLIGIDMNDVFSILRLCRTMHYFRRSGKDLSKINEVIDGLKKDIQVLPCANASHNGIVSIRADYSCGIEVVEQVSGAFEADGYWVNQITYHTDESDKSISMSMLLGT